MLALTLFRGFNGSSTTDARWSYTENCFSANKGQSSRLQIKERIARMLGKKFILKTDLTVRVQGQSWIYIPSLLNVRSPRTRLRSSRMQNAGAIPTAYVRGIRKI